MMLRAITADYSGDSYYQKIKMIFMWCHFLDRTYGTMINEKEFYSLVRQQQ
jgi:hypothetical protein